VGQAGTRRRKEKPSSFWCKKSEAVLYFEKYFQNLPYQSQFRTADNKEIYNTADWLTNCNTYEKSTQTLV
jgi:hypothetical protein